VGEDDRISPPVDVSLSVVSNRRLSLFITHGERPPSLLLPGKKGGARLRVRAVRVETRHEKAE